MHLVSRVDQASVEYGDIIHGIAVAVARRSADGKGKSELARRIGTKKDFIQAVTAGNAKNQDPALLRKLTLEVAGDIPPDVYERLHSLMTEIRGS